MLGFGVPGVVELIVIMMVSAITLAVIWRIIRVTRSSANRPEPRGFDVKTDEEHRKP